MSSPLTRNADPANAGHDPDGIAFGGPGAPTWRHATDGAIEARPTVGPERVYAGTATGRIIALDRTDGRTVWERDLPAEKAVTPVVLVDGTVFVGGFDDFGRAENTVHALDAATGEERWAAGSPRGTRAAPIVTRGVVVVSRRDNTIVARRVGDGSLDWERSAAGGGVAATRETVLHANSDGLAAYRLETGESGWHRSLDGTSTVAPVVDDGLVLAGRRSGALHALDARSGEDRWTVDLFRPEFHDDLRNSPPDGQGPPANRAAVSTLSVAAGTAFVGTCNAVFAIDTADGTRRWTRDLDCGYVRSSVAVGSRLHLGASDGSVYVLTHDGAIEYRLSPTDATTAWATVADGSLFVGGEAGPPGPHSEPTSGFLAGYVDS